MHTMQPTTHSFTMAYFDSLTARIAAGDLQPEDLAASPTVRNPETVFDDMVQFILERGSGTEDDLLLRFSTEEIATHLPKARAAANRFFVKQVA